MMHHATTALTVHVENIVWYMEYTSLVLFTYASVTDIFQVLIIFLLLMTIIVLLWFHIRVGSHKNLLYSIATHPSVHSWQQFKTSSLPIYCNGCGDCIYDYWIFRGSGLVCHLCGRYSHLKCLGHCEALDCRLTHASINTPLIHSFVQGNLSPDAVCCVCGVNCSSTFGLNGFKCLWCNRTCHEDCSLQIPRLCDMGLFEKFIVPLWAVSLQLPHHKRHHCVYPHLGFLKKKKNSGTMEAHYIDIQEAICPTKKKKIWCTFTITIMRGIIPLDY
eukprot:GHVR01180789.1.p1 GENE.GHVR01180789.1~~GHVR01180789.1.p1  ORF type:complete len:274 (+),score=19.30 GHVR01180789.1:48-869(+)